MGYTKVKFDEFKKRKIYLKVFNKSDLLLLKKIINRDNYNNKNVLKALEFFKPLAYRPLEYQELRPLFTLLTKNKCFYREFAVIRDILKSEKFSKSKLARIKNFLFSYKWYHIPFRELKKRLFNGTLKMAQLKLIKKTIHRGVNSYKAYFKLKKLFQRCLFGKELEDSLLEKERLREIIDDTIITKDQFIEMQRNFKELNQLEINLVYILSRLMEAGELIRKKRRKNRRHGVVKMDFFQDIYNELAYEDEYFSETDWDSTDSDKDEIIEKELIAFRERYKDTVIINGKLIDTSVLPDIGYSEQLNENPIYDIDVEFINSVIYNDYFLDELNLIVNNYDYNLNSIHYSSILLRLKINNNIFIDDKYIPDLTSDCDEENYVHPVSRNLLKFENYRMVWGFEGYGDVLNEYGMCMVIKQLKGSREAFEYLIEVKENKDLIRNIRTHAYSWWLEWEDFFYFIINTSEYGYDYLRILKRNDLSLIERKNLAYNHLSYQGSLDYNDNINFNINNVDLNKKIYKREFNLFNLLKIIYNVFILNFAMYMNDISTFKNNSGIYKNNINLYKNSTNLNIFYRKRMGLGFKSYRHTYFIKKLSCLRLYRMLIYTEIMEIYPIHYQEIRENRIKVSMGYDIFDPRDDIELLDLVFDIGFWEKPNIRLE